MKAVAQETTERNVTGHKGRPVEGKSKLGDIRPIKIRPKRITPIGISIGQGCAPLFRACLVLSVLTILVACVRTGRLHSSLPGSPISYDQSWKAALETSLVHYEQIAISDKEGGFFQTTWKIHKVGIIIGTPVRRSRLIGHLSKKTPFQLDLTMEQEAFTLELGRWVSDPPDEKRFSEIIRSARAQMRSR